MTFNRIFKYTLFLLVFVTGGAIFAQGDTCDDMEPICTDDGISFTAGIGALAEPGNDYDCLATQPNPSWYYLEVSEAGDIIMELYAGSDIDFIIWGPFDNLADARSNCGSLGGVDSPVVDCSYSGVAYETPEILGASVGDVYILLITNYAAVVQEVTLAQTDGLGGTNCGIVVECVVSTGSFNLKKNGVAIPTDDPINLCEGDEFEIISNDDFRLPRDTIAAPIGDGIYTAQLMWLVYTAAPIGDDPFADAGYAGIIIPSEDLMDINDEDSPIVTALGCGTYYLVPVTGDDGIGDGGANDNGSVTWDKDGNGCYELGTPIIVNYACPIEADAVINCGGVLGNAIDFNMNGGFGSYTVTSFGDGILLSADVANGGTVTISGLENGDACSFTVTDEEGCENTFTYIFRSPVIRPIVITPALSCPDASVGNVDVTIMDGSGNGAPYGVILNGTPNPGRNADIDGPAGAAILITAVDAEGCVTDSVVTITSAGHFIDTEIISTTRIRCFGENDGTAEVSGIPTNEFGLPDGVITDIIWTDPTGANFPGDETNTSRTGMMPGIWLVTFEDEYGCIVTVPVEILTPNELVLSVNTLNEPNCYGYSDGSIDLSVSGGTPGYDFSWKDFPDVTTDVLNTIGAGTYWGYVKDSKGCVDSIRIDVGQPDSLHADIVVKKVLCYGESTGSIIVGEVFNATGAVSYFWDLKGVVPNPATDINLAGGLSAGTYLIIIQDEFCDVQYDITITENTPMELVDVKVGPAYCREFDSQNGNGQVQVAAIGGVSDYSYLWTNLQNGVTKENSTWGGLNPGEYEIVVTDKVGCTLTDTIKVDSLNPRANFTVTSDEFYAPHEGTEVLNAHFVNTSENFANPLNPFADTLFFWNFDYNNTGWVFSDDYFETFDTSYSGENKFEVCLVAINKNGCTDTLCKKITVHAEPDFENVNIFSPNGDNVNDKFTFEYRAQAVETFKCVIVDRWGIEMFEFASINDAWDGTTKSGAFCSDGVYFYNYEILYTNGKEEIGQGTITLVDGPK